MIIIAGHAVFASDGKPLHGTGSEIGTFLQKKQRPYFFIKHSLYGDFPTLVNGAFYGLKRLPFFLKIIQDQIINFYFFFKEKKRIKFFIGIDPLNAFSGILAKKMGRVEKVVFYTADYAHERFSNPFLNLIYHCLDRFSIKHADQVWNVSTRIVKQREKQGVRKEKNFFVPNTPIFDKVKRVPTASVNQHDLVIVSHLTKALNYPLIFQVIKKLSVKYRDIRLLVIGAGPCEDEFKKSVLQMGMGKKILFLGRKPHDEVLKILSRSGIGIALYTQTQSWTKFGDSAKIREYFACGLPVITTNVSSTADDVVRAQAGLVIKLNEKEFKKAVDKLFSDKKLYQKMRRNGIKLARKYDFFKVIDKILSQLNCC